MRLQTPHCFAVGLELLTDLLHPNLLGGGEAATPSKSKPNFACTFQSWLLGLGVQGLHDTNGQEAVNGRRALQVNVFTFAPQKLFFLLPA